MNKLTVLALSVLTCAFLNGCGERAFVERVTVSNELAFPARVELKEESDGSRLTFATIGAGDERAVEQIIDRDVWIFVFSYGRTEAAELRIERADIEGQGWTIEVPEEFETTLRGAGLEPPGGDP